MKLIYHNSMGNCIRKN